MRWGETGARKGKRWTEMLSPPLYMPSLHITQRAGGAGKGRTRSEDTFLGNRSKSRRDCHAFRDAAKMKMLGPSTAQNARPGNSCKLRAGPTGLEPIHRCCDTRASTRECYNMSHRQTTMRIKHDGDTLTLVGMAAPCRTKSLRGSWCRVHPRPVRPQCRSLRVVSTGPVLLKLQNYVSAQRAGIAEKRVSRLCERNAAEWVPVAPMRSSAPLPHSAAHRR